MSNGKTIGETNGPWAVLLKVWLALMVPVLLLFVSMMVWLISNQYKDNIFRGEGERFTAGDAELQIQLIIARLEPRLVAIETQLKSQSGIRPSDVYKLVERLTKKVEALEKKVGVPPEISLTDHKPEH